MNLFAVFIGVVFAGVIIGLCVEMIVDKKP